MLMSTYRVYTFLTAVHLNLFFVPFSSNEQLWADSTVAHCQALFHPNDKVAYL